MNLFISYLLMAVGSVTALVMAAGPLDSSMRFKIGFGFSVLLIGVGAWLRRVSAKSLETETSLTGEMETIRTSLREIISLSEKEPEEQNFKEALLFLKTKSDSILSQRQMLLDSFGISDYAKIVSSLARIERAIHRSQSALSDGYFEEACDSFSKVHPFAKETIEMVIHEKP